MTYTVWSFVLTAASTGELAGIGLICPKPRYAAVQWVGVETPDRRQASWRGIEWQIDAGLDPSPLPKTSAIHQALTAPEASATCSVRFHDRRAIEIAKPQDVPRRLDAVLREIADEHGTRGQ